MAPIRRLPTSDEIDQLSVACDSATFFRGNKDVYDESCRMAVKINAPAVQFDPVRTDLIRIAQKKLLQRQGIEMSINAEIHKLDLWQVV